MKNLIGKKVIVNSPNGWGGKFHKCKGVVQSNLGDNTEYPACFEVLIKESKEDSRKLGFTEVNHYIQCSYQDVLMTV